MARLRVLVVEDHPMMRDAIRNVIEADTDARVVAEADNGRDAIALAARHKPDLAIMDIALKEMGGIEATARINEQTPSTRVLILSGFSGADVVIRSLAAGARGYLVKDSAAAAELKTAIDAIMAGDTYLSPPISKHVVAGLLDRDKAPIDAGLEVLSGRQREILKMVVGGKSTKEIAFCLHLSAKTVETHRARMMERLKIRDIPGLVVYAIRRGLIDIDAPRPQGCPPVGGSALND
jgi:DNA-binding NarL/FixJ family response regulator